MKQVLHETKDQMDRKDLQLHEKGSLIRGLETRLQEINPTALRESLMREVSEPMQRLEREKEALQRENQKLSYEIRMIQSQVQHLEKEMRDASDRVRLAHEADVNLLKKEKQDLRIQIMELSQTPDAAKFMAVQDENSKLVRQITTLRSEMQDAENKYVRMHKSMESLVSEYDKSHQEHEVQITNLKIANQEVREEKEMLQASIRDHKRTIQELNR